MNEKKANLEYFLFAEAWLCLAGARCMVIILPFKKIASFMGIHVENSNSPYQEPSGNGVYKPIGDAILRASRRSSWRTKCLEQALAGKFMLKVRGLRSTIFFGVAKSQCDSKSLIAHAWLVCNGQVVTGGRGLDTFTVVGKFEN